MASSRLDAPDGLVPGPRRAAAFVDQLMCAPEQLGVVEHEQVGIEDRRVALARFTRDLGACAADVPPGRGNRLPKASPPGRLVAWFGVG